MFELKKYKLKFITDKDGNKTEVIMKVKDFEELIEDLNDMAVAAERRDERTITHEELKKELKKDGLL